MSSTNFLAPRPDPWVHLPPLPAALPPESAPQPKKPRRRSRKRWFFSIFVLAFFALLVFVGIGFFKLAEGAFALKAASAEAQAALDTADLSGAKDALADVLLALNELNDGIKYFGFLEPVPWVGDQVTGAATTLTAGIETTEAVQEGLGIMIDALSTVQGAGSVVGAASGATETRSYSSLTSEEKYLLLHSLASSLPQLRQMQVKLRLAEHDLDRLDSLNLAPAVKNAIAPLRDKLPKLITAVDVIVPFAAIAPEYAGLGEEKQFLLLFLNNDELRPGGGFIGVYGLMLIKNGDLESTVTDDSYNVDERVAHDPSYPASPAPVPIAKFLGVQNWYFRDSSWSPDFGQTARDGAQLFRQEMGWGGQPVPSISGVVGITPDFISSLLKFVGPVTVDGQTFTSGNIADALEYQVEQQYAIEGIPPAQRKGIVSKVTDEVVKRLMAIPPSKWTDFFQILDDSFHEKQIALMSYDEGTEASLIDSGWAGFLNPAKGDDVEMVVDANLGAMKTDPLVDRHITYSVRPYGSGFRATTSIAYTNNAKKYDWKTTRYRTYTRVYAPLGSKFVSSTGTLAQDLTYDPSGAPGEVTVADDLGMTSFGAFTEAEINSSHTLSFTYDLPQTVTDAIKRGDYTLNWFKQMGARDNSLTLDLNFGTTVTAAEPAEGREDWGDNSYSLDITLDTDKEFRVRL